MIHPAIVEETYRDCLFKEEELGEPRVPPEGAVIAEGVMFTSAFQPDRLQSHADEIKGMLSLLPAAFFPESSPGGGGGWSFLNFCTTSTGELWTGEHRTCDLLIQLGIGLGLITFLLPRDAWPMLPGGVPYLLVDLSA